MEAENDAPPKMSGLSFGFSKKKESKTLQKGAFKDTDTIVKDDTEYIESAERLLSKPKKQEEVLVIPLIQTNKWKPAKPEELDQDDGLSQDQSHSKGSNVQSTGDSVTDLAVKEILQGQNKDEDSKDVTIPLLMRNKVPEGFETDDRLDVSLRPDGAEVADYDAVPIEQYGLAMLRGMGWKDGEGIGRNNKTVAPVQAILRPKGMGLGADKSKLLHSKNSSDKKSNNEEELEWKKGAYCVVESGKNEGLYGQVEGVNPDDARVVVKLTIGGKSVTLSQYITKLVTKKEYDQFSKYLNKSKVDKFKKEESQIGEKASDYESDQSSFQKHKSKHKRERSPEENKHSSRRENGSDRHSGRDWDADESRKPKHKEKKRKHRDDDTRNRKSGKSSIRSEPRPWLRANLRVRMVDPDYKKGRYFKSKVIIEDVIGCDSCVCRTDDGKVLEGLSQKQLETVIPRNEPAYVMIVSGSDKGQIGEVLQKDKAACTASVQLLSDRDVLLSLSYDSICEYLGDVSDFDV